MSTINHNMGSAGGVRSGMQGAAERASVSTVFEALTRVGYAVRGLIYITIGLLAAEVALNRGGSISGPQAAISALARQPAGLVLVWVILVGLVSYTLWGIVRAVFDPLHKGHDLKGLAARFGFLVSALGYAVLILPTYALIPGVPQISGGSTGQNFIPTLMAMPWGRAAVGILGLGVLLGGLYQIYLGFSSKFDRQFHTYAITAEETEVVTMIGRFGTAARGVVFALAGFLIGLAAYQANPSQPTGMDAALSTLQHQPYGPWLLGVIAAGLIAFGFYSLLCAAWLRLKR